REAGTGTATTHPGAPQRPGRPKSSPGCGCRGTGAKALPAPRPGASSAEQPAPENRLQARQRESRSVARLDDVRSRLCQLHLRIHQLEDGRRARAVALVLYAEILAGSGEGPDRQGVIVACRGVGLVRLGDVPPGRSLDVLP